MSKKKRIFENIKYKNFNNTLIILLIVVFFGGYIVFFTSPYYMAGVGNFKYTELSKPETLENNRDIQLLNWTYSKSQHCMEVEILVDNKSFDGRDTYAFSAIFRPSNRKVEIQKIVEESNYIVLHITGVPKNFQQISLRMYVEDNPSEPIRLYSNIDQITKVENIEILTRLEYHLRRIERNIASFDEQIDSLNNEIKGLQDKILNIKKASVKLEEDKRYQTLAEINRTNEKIAENEKSIDETEKQILELEKQRKEIENLRAQAAERLKELQSE